jgi:hypothetical protein
MAILELLRTECEGANCPLNLKARLKFGASLNEVPTEVMLGHSLPPGTFMTIPDSDLFNDFALWIYTDLPNFNRQDTVIGITQQRFRSVRTSPPGTEEKTLITSFFPQLLPPTCDIFLYYRIWDSLMDRQNNLTLSLDTVYIRSQG